MSSYADALREVGGLSLDTIDRFIEY
jgi:hypothetical protein